MADTGGVRIEGLTRMVRDLQRLGLEVDDLKEVMSEIAEEAAAHARWFAPKRTGRLAGSIRPNRAKAKAVVTAGKVRVPYAGPINYGWPARHIQASEFLQRADAVMLPKAVPMLEDGIMRKIRERGLG